jgi:hypothetical protein
MTSRRIALTAILLVAGGAQAQLIAPALQPALQSALQTERPAALRNVPSFPRYVAHGEGLPPADPLALDLYRADPKLFAGVDLNSRLGIEATFNNPNYREGLHYIGFGPRLAQGIPLAVGGFDLNVGARLSVPVDDRIDAFGTLGVATVVRKKHDISTADVGTLASVGATYKVNSRQTATAEIPLGAIARKAMSGSTTGLGASVKLGF